MAGIITTGNHPKLLWPGVNAIWGHTYEEQEKQYVFMFDKYTSEKNYEDDVQIVSSGLAPVKQQGAGVAYDSEIQGFTTRYVHAAVALGYIVTHEELSDNLYMEVSSRRAKWNAFSMSQTKENIGANVYNRAFNASYTGGDAVSLCNSAHPNTSGGTWSNVPSVAADLSEAALEDMNVSIMNATNDKGLRISIRPKSLIIAPANVYNANRILKSVYQSGTANNDINALKATGAFPEGIKVCTYLTTNSAAWFIRTNAPNGMKYFEREAIQFTQDNDFDTMNAKAKSYERYSFGWTDPRGLYGSNGP